MRCPTCDDFVSEYVRHHCPPRWWCWDPGNGEREDASPVYAVDAEAAAEKYAERSDQEGDYSCVTGSPLAVHVAADDSDASVEVFLVEGEAVPTYTGYQVQPPPDTTVLRIARCTRADGRCALSLEDLDGHKRCEVSVAFDGHPPPELDDYVFVAGDPEKPTSVAWGHKGRHVVEL